MRDHPTAEWQALPLYIRASFWTGMALSAVFHVMCLLSVYVIYDALSRPSSGLPLGGLVMLLGLTFLSVYNTVNHCLKFIRELS